MNATEEVLHIVRNDLKRFRWGIAAFALLVAVAAAHAVYVLRLDRVPSYSTFFAALPLLIFVAGVVSVATLIQSDSPTRFDAFWATKPVRPAAMYSAKVITVAVSVVAVATIGQFVAFVSVGIPAGAALPAVGVAVRAIVTGLLIAALVAAVTRDLRTFLGTAVVSLVLVVPFAASDGTRVVRRVLNDDGALRVTRLLVLTAAAVLFWLYHARASGWRAKAFVMLVALCTTLFSVQSAVARPAYGTGSKGNPAPRRATVTAALLDDTISVDWVLPSAPPRSRFVLVNPGVTLVFADGTGAVISYDLPQSKLPFNEPPRVAPADSGAVAASHSAVHMSFGLLDTLVRRLTSESASLVIDGTIVEQAAVTLADLPMKPGAHGDVDAARVTFRRVHDTASVQRIEIQAVSPLLEDDGEGTPSNVLRAPGSGGAASYGTPAFFGRSLTFVATGNAGQDTVPLRSIRISVQSVPLVLPPGELYWHYDVLVPDRYSPVGTRVPRLPANPRLVITGWRYRSHSAVHELIPLRTSPVQRRGNSPATPP